jgi:sugar lactone lactonase YvrE
MRPTIILVLLAALASPISPGTIDSVAGSGEAGSSGDGGAATSARLREPFGCELDGRGHLYIADAADGRIRKVDLASGKIETVAGVGAGREVGTPYAVAVDEDDNLYVVDQKTPVVRKVDGKTGQVSILAGTGTKGYSGDGGPATNAKLREPNDCCLDGRGGLLIADVADWRVRRVDLTTGIITTFAGTGRPAIKLPRERLGDHQKAVDAVLVGPRAVCNDGRGNTYICEREGNSIRWVDTNGTIVTYAGTGEAGYSGDGGLMLDATFRGPKGLRIDPQGSLYVVDTENHAIRKIDPNTAKISTVAGGHKGPDGDGGEATKAGLDRPHGIAVAPDGTLYIADSNNHRVRRVAPR